MAHRRVARGLPPSPRLRRTAVAVAEAGQTARIEAGSQDPALPGPAIALAALLLLAAAACGVKADGPPRIEVDRTGCAHCGMLVSDVVYAAAYRATGADPRVFDDIGCMAAELRQLGAGDRRVWVHDFESGEWVDGERAVYVHAGTLRTPMGGGFIAFRARGAAERVAAEKHGRVLASLGDVLAFSGRDGRP